MMRYHIDQIGTIHSPFASKESCPIQGAVAPAILLGRPFILNRLTGAAHELRDRRRQGEDCGSRPRLFVSNRAACQGSAIRSFALQ